MVEQLHPPPPPSLPREVPWREIEETIAGLRAVASKLDTLISIYTGVAPPAVVVTPPVTPIIPAPPELEPITSRLDALIAGLVGNLPTFATGQKDVITAGEPEQLDDWPIPDGFKLTVIARPGNTGSIYLGKNKGECANNKRRFDGLGAGLAHSLRVKNVNAVWVDSSVQGTTAAPEGVSWSVEAYR
ncbi:unnamed protein product [marine sediment metagenome]|uniref:Uncharacterized protein n=1 Tax=marine sediment metagenome TaxID=412755 RepID=X1QLL5_9ZZZZ